MTGLHHQRVSNTLTFPGPPRCEVEEVSCGTEVALESTNVQLSVEPAAELLHRLWVTLQPPATLPTALLGCRCLSHVHGFKEAGARSLLQLPSAREP